MKPTVQVLRATQYRNQSGFTITELMVSVAIAAIASMLMVTAFVYTYGSVVVEQTRASMTRDSQVFLRRVVEDIRLSNQILETNTITDANSPSGGWVTNNPADILIATSPATNSERELIFDPITGYPYQHEVVYFSNDGKMYRRFLRNNLALDSTQNTTCPAGTTGCPSDAELVGNVASLLFEFFDINDDPTVVASEARSVKISVSLQKKVYGQDIETTNSTRITLRNDN